MITATQLARAVLEDDELSSADAKRYVMKHAKPQVMTVILMAFGNEDFRQDPSRPFAPTQHVKVNSFKEASVVCRRYIVDNDLGGGNWHHEYDAQGKRLKECPGDIFQNGKRIARVSYNGRVWDLKGNEIPLT